MAGESFNFGRAELLDVEAVGRPGNRRFRLFARSALGKTASLWMEREQMDALAQAMDQLLAQVSGRMVLRPEAQAAPPATSGVPADFPEFPDVDFQVGQLQLGYDEDDEQILLRARPLEIIEEGGELTAREDAEPLFAAALSTVRAARLSAHIAGVLNAGRPRCPLCGRPMEANHICEKQNGFHPVGLN